MKEGHNKLRKQFVMSLSIKMWGWRDLNSRSTGLSDDADFIRWGFLPENTEISAPTAPHRPPRRAVSVDPLLIIFLEAISDLPPLEPVAIPGLATAPQDIISDVLGQIHCLLFLTVDYSLIVFSGPGGIRTHDLRLTSLRSAG